MFVDVRRTNTQPLLPLIFIIDSSVKKTFFQYLKVLFLIWFLAQRRRFFLLVALIKGFLRTWWPLYPKDFSRGRVILPRIRFWISSPHFCDKALAVALLSSFTNFTSYQWSATSSERFHIPLQSKLSQNCCHNTSWYPLLLWILLLNL
jgi:hypothetical protein